MQPLLNFDNWEIDRNTPFGSGASRKNWLVSPDGLKGIFKYPKQTANKTLTGEYWAEKLAYELATILGIPCANVDMGRFNNEIGSMSYMLLNEDESLAEGISYIANLYPNYDSDTFYDKNSDTWYSIQMIMHSIKEIGLEKEFLKIPVFDCLIGNSDRHHSNWGAVINNITNEVKICPLYDNGSSLCSIVNENKITTSDKNWLNAQIDTKSESMIRFENIKKKPTHFQMMKYCCDNYYDDIANLIMVIKERLTDETIRSLIYEYQDEIISAKMKEFLIIFIMMKRDKMIQIFDRM